MLEIQNYIIDNYYDIYAAEKLTNMFFKNFIDLTYFPEAFQLLEDLYLKSKGVRIKKLRKYNIYYKVEDYTVIILMVCNSRRPFMNVVKELLKRV